MASERTRALRTPKKLPRIIEQGPTFTETLKGGQLVSANRRNRLRADATGLDRAQRVELAKLRDDRRWSGREPLPPAWSKPKPDEVAKPDQIKIITDDARGLFERGVIGPGPSFDDWYAKHFVRDVPITRKQLDAALGELMNRVKDIDVSEGVTDGDRG